MRDFLYSGNWFENKYRVSSDSRYITFKTALNLFVRRGGKTIVETGTTRVKDDWGGGMATLLFGDVISRYGGKLYTVDISSEALAVSKEVTAEYASLIEYIESDSVEFLRKFSEPIDLLYLDSVDYPYGPILEEFGGKDDLNKAIQLSNQVPEEMIWERFGHLIKVPQEHQLKEYLVASSNLSDGSVVLLDDNQLPCGGKTKMTKEVLLADGWELLVDSQQSLWQKKRG